MRTLQVLALAPGLVAAASSQAQPAAPPAPAPKAQPPAVGGRGPGPGGMAHGALMTPEERETHMAKMHGFTTRKDCEAYQAEHHRQMAARAKERGVALPAEPQGHPCARLP